MKLRYLAWLLPLFFCCCHKGGNNSNKNNLGFTFTTTYDSVITSYVNNSFTLSFNVDVLTGSITGNPITYSITGLPADVIVTPTSLSVEGQLGGTFKFNFGSTSVSNDTVNFIISSSVNGTQKHKLILNIQPLPDYSSTLAGTYSGAYDYSTPYDGFYYFTSVVSTVTGMPYTINIGNVRIHDTTILIIASLSNIVTVPFQTIGTYSIWGTGTYSHDNPPNSTLYQMTVYDTTVHNGADTEACIMHIQH